MASDCEEKPFEYTVCGVGFNHADRHSQISVANWGRSMRFGTDVLLAILNDSRSRHTRLVYHIDPICINPRWPHLIQGNHSQGNNYCMISFNTCFVHFLRVMARSPFIRCILQFEINLSSKIQNPRRPPFYWL